MSKFRVLKWDRSIEKQLVANGLIAAGEEVVREKPLVKVAKGDYELGTYAWDLTHQLVADAVIRDAYFSWQVRGDDIFAINPHDTEIEKYLAKRYDVPRPMVRKLYIGVGTNNIGYGPYDPDVRGHGLYEHLSRSNHSCDPTAMMVGLDATSGELSCVALKEIQRDQEITWNYMGEKSGFLKGNFLARNVALVHHYGFVCRCSRCRTEIPDDLKKVDLLHFFKTFLQEHARKSASR